VPIIGRPTIGQCLIGASLVAVVHLFIQYYHSH